MSFIWDESKIVKPTSEYGVESFGHQLFKMSLVFELIFWTFGKVMQWIGITRISIFQLHHGRHIIRMDSLTIKVSTQVSQEMIEKFQFVIIKGEFS